MKTKTAKMADADISEAPSEAQKIATASNLSLDILQVNIVMTYASGPQTRRRVISHAKSFLLCRARENVFRVVGASWTAGRKRFLAPSANLFSTNKGCVLTKPSLSCRL